MPEENIYIAGCIKQIEGGKPLKKVVKEVEVSLLKELINRGYNSSKKLAGVLGEKEQNVWKIFSVRGISIKKERKNNQLK